MFETLVSSVGIASEELFQMVGIALPDAVATLKLKECLRLNIK